MLQPRLEFYEEWLNPKAMRDGRIGIAPLAAVSQTLVHPRYACLAASAARGSVDATSDGADLPGLSDDGQVEGADGDGGAHRLALLRRSGAG